MYEKCYHKISADTTSAAIPGGGSFKAIVAQSLLKNGVGNAFELDADLKYKGIGSNGFDATNAALKTAVGTAFDVGVGAISKLPVANKAQLGRWENLSYKAKYANMLTQSKTNAFISGCFDSQGGKILTGTVTAGTINAIRKKDGQ
jgi:hypothetical protein